MFTFYCTQVKYLKEWGTSLRFVIFKSKIEKDNGSVQITKQTSDLLISTTFLGD